VTSEAKRNNRALRRTASKWIKRVLLAAFGLGLLAMIVFAWLPKPVAVETALAAKGKLVVTVDEDGRTRVKDRYVISAPLMGNVARVELRPGDSVKQGDVLARLVPLTAPLLDARTKKEAEARVSASGAARLQAKAQIRRAEATLEYAKKQAKQTRELVKKGVVAEAEADRANLEERSREAELTSAKFGAKVADHELSMARAALGAFSAPGKVPSGDQMVVPSPVAGRVLKVIQESEGVVQAGAPLVEVGDPSALEIVVDVLTSDAVRIPAGARVLIERWGGETLHGRVRLVEPSAFTRLSALGVEEQRVNAVIDLDEPYAKWKALMDGYRVEAKIIVWQGDDVVKVPSSALFRSGDGWAVFVTRDGRAVTTSVQLGQNNGLEAQILEGLAAGDRVVVHPSDRVADGVRVDYR
jgi:HlyD family secretion protein